MIKSHIKFSDEKSIEELNLLKRVEQLEIEVKKLKQELEETKKRGI